jgi:hypothetical protein
MAYLTLEGTKDFIVSTPALIVTFVASGSIAAGNGLKWDAGNSGNVWADTAGALGKCAGVALATVSDDDYVPVLVWGYAKNLVAFETMVPGDTIMLSSVAQGPGFIKETVVNVSGSVGRTIYKCGVCVSNVTSGSGGAKFLALINCM